MLRVFIGFDPRQAISYNALQFSIVRHSSEPVAITPLILEQLPLKRAGLTPFTYSRFLVPWLCDFEGKGIFLDADIILRDDLNKAGDIPDNFAVAVADTKPIFERAAFMVFNCGHPDNLCLTPEYISVSNNLHNIGWTNNIGKLPNRFNHLVGYDKPGSEEDPAVVHYTMGVPAWPEVADCEFASLWHDEVRLMNSRIKNYKDLMGNSVHVIQNPDGTVTPRYKAQDGPS